MEDLELKQSIKLLKSYIVIPCSEIKDRISSDGELLQKKYKANVFDASAFADAEVSFKIFAKFHYFKRIAA